MPEDLKKQIIEAIAASGDDNYKRLLMLLLRVEEIFLERIDTLQEQMTVKPELHAQDHDWIKNHRDIEGAAKGTALKILGSLLEKGALVAAGAAAAKFIV